MPDAIIVDTSKSQCGLLQSVPVNAVKLTDSFWAPRRETNRTVMLPSQYQQCEDSGRIDNFRRASGRKNAPFRGIYFNDSDVYKWLEASAWTLAGEEDASLRTTVDALIDEIEAAQQPDGYLNTYYMFEKAADRWTDLKVMHELYCGGHMIQAAIACKRALGDEKLLGVACRFADLICGIFGNEEGKRPGTCGHAEIEMAMAELYRETGEQRYLQAARHFVEARGHGLFGGDYNLQDHETFVEMHDITGHAVRAVYLNAGATDIYAETGDETYKATLDCLWDSMTERRMYVTGGIGSRYSGEEFGEDYELPNERAYAETCAGIGSFMWNWRMLLLTGQARYTDVMETVLYNGILAGGGLDGDTYFYQNPLADGGKHRRKKWFGCACCPPNLARQLASLPGYFYSTSPEGIWAHLYASHEARLTLPDGAKVELRQSTQYPHDGRISIEVIGCESDSEWTLFLRVPQWCAGTALTVNDETVGRPEAGAYFPLRRVWKNGDMVELTLPMEPRRVSSHPYVMENTGRVALGYGPFIFCLEAVDHPEVDLRDVVLPPENVLKASYRSELLHGITVLEGSAVLCHPENWSGKLYSEQNPGASSPQKTLTLKAIPYFAWANREPGQMQVWIREK